VKFLVLLLPFRFLFFGANKRREFTSSSLLKINDCLKSHGKGVGSSATHHCGRCETSVSSQFQPLQLKMMSESNYVSQTFFGSLKG
jgi:hypothetical protein